LGGWLDWGFKTVGFLNQEGQMKLEELAFRPLDVSDVHFLATYAAHCEALAPEDERARIIEGQLRQRFRDPDYFGVIALLGDEPIGFADGAIAGESLELNEVYVADKYRCQGVGRRLLEEIISLAQARCKKVKRAAFRTEPDNQAMRHLAEKLAFDLKALTYEKAL